MSKIYEAQWPNSLPASIPIISPPTSQVTKATISDEDLISLLKDPFALGMQKQPTIPIIKCASIPSPSNTTDNLVDSKPDVLSTVDDTAHPVDRDGAKPVLKVDSTNKVSKKSGDDATYYPSKISNSLLSTRGGIKEAFTKLSEAEKEVQFYNELSKTNKSHKISPNMKGSKPNSST
ncbi:hypothetical protein JB92DRAFT_2832758 [Gautieria morchelliformis]|nr:hypothetical protein JB92DRAFT_2832758 [Gautieria morchelliformis]